MATIHNVDLSTGTTFFSSTAATLPLGMFSQKELTGHGLDTTVNMRMGLWGALTGSGDRSELQYTKNDIYNALPRDTNELETIRSWDYTDNNMSFSIIDNHQDYNAPTLSKSIQLPNYSYTIDYENPFKISSDVLNNMNRYQYVYKNALISQLYSYQVNESGKQYWLSHVVPMPVTPSLFNPFLGVVSTGIAENTPLVDLEEDEETVISITTNNFVGKGVDGGDGADKQEDGLTKNVLRRPKDLSNCTIKKLVELSKVNSKGQCELGRARYKWADFMYCKDLGKYSNNMLITLRKFPIPIGDNIMSDFGRGDRTDNITQEIPSTEVEINMPPDIGRMVCWLGNDNKLEDIIKFSTKDTWKELHSEDQQQESKEDSTMIGGILSLGNPDYIKSVAAGVAGGHNPVLGMFAGRSSIMTNQGQHESNPAMNGTHYDDNKVYTRTGTIQDTHVYEGKLQFTHSFRLVFDYELRAYENINPRAAFLDLLGNILITCYRKGTFWGGQRSFIGGPGPGSQHGWNLANDFIDTTANATGGFLEHILSGGKGGLTLTDALGKIGMTDLAKMAKEKFNDLLNGGGLSGDTAHRVGKTTADLLGGMVKNKFGRPQVYAFKSLLTGDPVGLWHVTIGNPRNPILSMGNLIIESTDYQFYGPLGIDDFPTGLKVTVNLKHAKSRDAGEIAQMFTKGQSAIVMSLIGGNSKNNITDFVDQNEADYNYDVYGSNMIWGDNNGDTKHGSFVTTAFATVGS
jgi:hypothetical protein